MSEGYTAAFGAAILGAKATGYQLKVDYDKTRTVFYNKQRDWITKLIELQLLISIKIDQLLRN